MKSVPELRTWLARLQPRGIVARTSLSILWLAIVMGLLFSMLGSRHMDTVEHERLNARVAELAATVESTVSVACFVEDKTLAREIAAGLMKNRVVAGVHILAGGQTLFREGVRAALSAKGGGSATVSRTIYSPFDGEMAVGQLVLYVSNAEIEAQAAAYSRYAMWMMALQVAVMAGAAAFLVYFLVTRPIKGVSDELHGLQIHSGMRLTRPPGGHDDEVAQLVDDVNELIARLTDTLSAEKNLRIEHQISERRMRLVVEKADTGILVLDGQGAVQSCNPAFVRILGPGAATPGALLADLLAPHGLLIANLIEQSSASGEPRDADLEVELGGTRGTIWVELSVNPLGPNLLQGLVNDITERKRVETEVLELASSDAVTGLLNRRGVDAALAAQLAAPRQESRTLAVLLIDLDHFKAVNDTHGHEAGDRVLRSIAGVLEGAVRRNDVVGRIGGDEFVVVLPGIENAERAEQIAGNILAGTYEPVDIGNGKRAHVGASIGIALAQREGDSAAALLKRADEAMYAAKQSGRGRISLSRPPTGESSESAAA